MRRQSCQQDGAEQQRERAAPPGHVCASAHGGVSGAQSRFAGADCPAGQPCRPADCRAPCRMESVHVSPPLPLRQCMRRGAFSCGRGDCPAGACLLHPRAEPGRRLQPQQKRSPAGGLPCLPPAYPALPESAGGAWRFWLPACPAFSFIFCPHPPSPLPLRGRGRDYSFLMQGAAPLASPGLNPGGTYSPNKKGTRRGACHVCRLPTMPLVYFLSPIPPTPFPSGEGGD